MQSNPNCDYDSSSASDEADATERVVVLARNNDVRQKEIKIIFGDAEDTIVEVLPKSQGELKARVIINRQEIPVSTQQVYEYKQNGRTLLKIFGMPTGEVRLFAPLHNLELLHYAESVRLTVSQDYMNDVQGLCGTHNGDNFDFITPQNYVLQKPEEFAATWALSSEGHIAQAKQRAQQHSMYKKAVVLTNVISEQDAGRADSRGRQHRNQKSSAQDYDSSSGSDSSSSSSSSSESQEDDKHHNNELRKSSQVGCTTRRITVIEKDGKHCFSLEPQVTCATHCQAEKTEMRSGKFFCAEKSSTTEHWSKMVARGANPDFRKKGSSVEMKFEYPTKCLRQ